VQHRVRLQQQPVEVSDQLRRQEEPERLVGEEAQRGAEPGGGLIDECRIEVSPVLVSGEVGLQQRRGLLALLTHV
jgi:hypothetical protein